MPRTFSSASLKLAWSVDGRWAGLTLARYVAMPDDKYDQGATRQCHHEFLSDGGAPDSSKQAHEIESRGETGPSGRNLMRRVRGRQRSGKSISEPSPAVT